MITVLKRMRRKNSKTKDFFKLAHHIVFVLAITYFTICPAAHELDGGSLDHNVINSRASIQNLITKTFKSSPRLLGHDFCPGGQTNHTLEVTPAFSFSPNSPPALQTTTFLLDSTRLIL